MPLIASDTEMVVHNIGSTNFSFSGTRITDLGATEYTLVTIAVDVTGSTHNFAAELRLALISAVEACQKSPRAENLLLRVITFSTAVGGVHELHGFTPLSTITASDYPTFRPDGMTPLYDAVYSAVGAMIDYGKVLRDGDFLANGIAFIITDGADNSSTETPRTIATKLATVTQQELLESLVTVLIGINSASCETELKKFKADAGIDQYIDCGDATKGRLAKLASFVSQSISSTSQALGTGGPSRQIPATF